LLISYQTYSTLFNNDSDKPFLSYPLRKIFNSQPLKSFLFKDLISLDLLNDTHKVLRPFDNYFTTIMESTKILTLSSSNQNILSADQNLRQYKNILTTKTNFNLNGTIDFNKKVVNLNSHYIYYNFKSFQLNSALFSICTSNRLNLDLPFIPIFDSFNLRLGALNYDTSNTLLQTIAPTLTTRLPLTLGLDFYKKGDVSLLKGKREGAPEFLNITY